MSLNEYALVSKVKKVVLSAFHGRFKSHKRVYVGSWKVSFPCFDRLEAN